MRPAIRLLRNNNSNDNYSYYNENGRLVTGAAAQLHKIYTVDGGVKKHNDMLRREGVQPKEIVHRKKAM